MFSIWPYLIIFLTICAAGVGIPIPEELPIVGAGLMAAKDSHPPVYWWLMMPVCIVAVVVCDAMLYGSGRLWGPRLLESRWMQKVLSRDKRQKIEGNFHKYGVMVLLFARLLPTIRAPIFIMAGVMRVPFSKFVLADAIYAIPGVNLLFWLAFVFGGQFEDLVKAFEGRVAHARPIIILLLIVAVVAYLCYHFFRHPVATGDPKQEVPVIGGQVAAKITHETPAPSTKSPANGLGQSKRILKYVIATAGSLFISLCALFAILFFSFRVLVAVPVAVIAGAASFVGTLRVWR